jgi:hypothetical protein
MAHWPARLKLPRFSPGTSLGMFLVLAVVVVGGLSWVAYHEGRQQSAQTQVAERQVGAFKDPILALCAEGGDVALRLQGAGLCTAASAVASNPAAEASPTMSTDQIRQIQALITSELSRNRVAGPSGPAGPAGAPGTSGTPGTPGQPGTPAPVKPSAPRQDYPAPNYNAQAPVPRRGYQSAPSRPQSSWNQPRGGPGRGGQGPPRGQGPGGGHGQGPGGGQPGGHGPGGGQPGGGPGSHGQWPGGQPGEGDGSPPGPPRTGRPNPTQQGDGGWNGPRPPSGSNNYPGHQPYPDSPSPQAPFGGGNQMSGRNSGGYGGGQRGGGRGDGGLLGGLGIHLGIG